MRPRSTFATSVMPCYLRLLLLSTRLLRLIVPSKALCSKPVLHKDATGREEYDQKQEEDRMNSLEQKRETKRKHHAAGHSRNRYHDMLAIDYRRNATRERNERDDDIRMLNATRHANRGKRHHSHDEDEHGIDEHHHETTNRCRDERDHLGCEVVHWDIERERSDKEEQLLEVPLANIGHRRPDEDRVEGNDPVQESCVFEHIYQPSHGINRHLCCLWICHLFVFLFAFDVETPSKPKAVHQGFIQYNNSLKPTAASQ